MVIKVKIGPVKCVLCGRIVASCVVTSVWAYEILKQKFGRSQPVGDFFGRKAGRVLKPTLTSEKGCSSMRQPMQRDFACGTWHTPRKSPLMADGFKFLAS